MRCSPVSHQDSLVARIAHFLYYTTDLSCRRLADGGPARTYTLLGETSSSREGLGVNDRPAYPKIFGDASGRVFLGDTSQKNFETRNRSVPCLHGPRNRWVVKTSRADITLYRATLHNFILYFLCTGFCEKNF